MTEARQRAAHHVATVPAPHAATVPAYAIDDGAYENEDVYHSDDAEQDYCSESSDDLDWDPDRERMMRTLRANGAFGYSTSKTSSNTSTSGSFLANHSERKSLAERCAFAVLRMPQ